MKHDDADLPVLNESIEDPGESEAVCSPTNYVTNEQAAIAARMRSLRAEAEEIREQLRTCGDTQRKQELEARLRDLRRQREELAERREQAIHRKMVMLGHEPPDPLL